MDTANVLVRHAVLNDAAALLKFMNTLADENLDTISGLRLSPEEEREIHEKSAKKERAFSLVAFDAGDVIGTIDLWDGDKPHNHRRGIGRKL